MNKRLAATAVFAAVLAVLSMVVIPLPAGVPVTLQTFGAALCGACLGWKRGTVAVAVYLALGGCGLPVFAGFGGGIGWLLGPTGGFLWGILPLAALCGAVRGGFWKRFGLGLAGLFVCCLMGTLQYACVTETPLWSSFLGTCAPFLWKDVACVAGAAWLAKGLLAKIFQ